MSTMVFILLLIYIVGIYICFVILRLGKWNDNFVDLDVFISFIWPVSLILFVLNVVLFSPFYLLDKIIKKFKS